MPPTQPIAPPAFSAPAMPPAAGPVPSFRTAPVASQGPGLGSQLATMIPALLMGLKDPLSMGAAMRGIQKARDRAMAQRETAQENADRKARERVDFYGRMLENAAQFNDEIEFTDWKRRIAPAAEYHGIPVESVTFNAGKGAAQERGVVQAAVDMAIKRLGVEVLNDDGFTLTLPGGREISMVTARQMLGGDVKKGGVLVPAPKPARTLIAHDPTRALVDPITGEVVTPAKAGTSDDQEWVIRGGVVTPIQKGTRQIGDRPYQAPSQAQPREPREPNYLTLTSPDGKRQQRVVDGPQSNALLEQGWKLHDAVAARQAASTDPIGADAITRSAVDLATRLFDHPGLSKATGAYELRGFTQAAIDANAIRDQLVAALALPNLGALKGPMSDKDVLFVKQISTRLANRRLSYEETRKAIQEAQLFLKGKLGESSTSDTAETPEQRGARLLRELTK